MKGYHWVQYFHHSSTIVGHFVACYIGVALILSSAEGLSPSSSSSFSLPHVPRP